MPRVKRTSRSLLARALPALALLLQAAHPAIAFAQREPLEIPVERLREDVRVMRTALEESHVGLHWFISRADLDRRLEEVAAGLDRPMTARELHRRLLPVVAAVRHGHTTLELPVQGVGYRLRQLDGAGAYFPAEVRVLDGRLYVVADLTADGGMPPGTEIVAIDGRPAGALLDTLRLYVSADGANDTFKLHQLGHGFQFAFLLDLLFGPSRTYALDVVPRPGEAMVRRVVAAQAPERMTALYGERMGRGLDVFPPALELRLLDGGPALLTVRSFYEGLLGPDHPGFEAFFASAFRRIRESGVQALVVDVRGNEGGNGDYVPLLYSYLADRPFRLSAPTILASASLSTLAWAENPSDDIRAFAASPGDFVTRAADGTWVLNEDIDEERYRTYEPRPDAFKGRLYVLTDGGSFSAANDFVDMVYRYHRREGRSVRFVGEQNGGDSALGWASGGQTLTLVLPNSGLKLRIPLLGGRQHFGAYPGTAVLPDHPVTPSIQDVLAGVDRPLQFVIDRIARCGAREDGACGVREAGA
jgi:hypothetical protein